MAGEERAYLLGVGGLAQPDESLDMHLMDTLFGEAEVCADGGEGCWGLVTQAIVGHNNGPQVVGQAGHQVTESGLDGR
jgi:hypothetical protein